MKNTQLEVLKKNFTKCRLAEADQPKLSLEDDEILVQVEKFAYTANNITYAAAGDVIGYWQFFPPLDGDSKNWGVIPVWGFARVVKSEIEELPQGERLFGYFPPAKFLKMKPTNISPGRFIEGSDHRSELPVTYNLYRRVNNEKGYNPAFDRERMLLFPLHLTAFSIWDFLKEENWFGADQVIILSASSKTSTGLAYALQADEDAPTTIGLTSASNVAKLGSLEIYQEVMSYDLLKTINANLPTIIVDMSGNNKIMAELHQHLGEQMKFTSKVGLTHWTERDPEDGIITERSKFFFAPNVIQKRIKEWGAAEFQKRSSHFLTETAIQTSKWLKFRTIDGLQELEKIHDDVCNGRMKFDEGLIISLGDE